MKKSNKFGVVLLAIFSISIVSGCSGHSQNNSEDTGSSIPAPSTGTISRKTDADSSVPVDMEKIMEDQRVNLENEKTLREDTSLAAKVNNIPIYQWQIDIEMNNNNRLLENYRTQLDAMNLSEQEKIQYMDAYTATLMLNKKDIMNKLIRDAVIQMEIGKRSLFPADEEVVVKAQEQFASIKRTPAIYESAQLYMEVMNLSEEDYLGLIIDEHKKVAGQTKLYEQITAGVEADADKTKAFNAAVDEWITKANIIIVNNQE